MRLQVAHHYADLERVAIGIETESFAARVRAVTPNLSAASAGEETRNPSGTSSRTVAHATAAKSGRTWSRMTRVGTSKLARKSL
jgi:hypothetical protein